MCYNANCYGELGGRKKNVMQMLVLAVSQEIDESHKNKKKFKKLKTVEEYINVLCIYLPSIKTKRRESIQAILPKSFPPPIITW